MTEIPIKQTEIITMQHIITDEEVERYNTVFILTRASVEERTKAALADFLNNRPESTLGKLRPIAKMSEKPPEGCKRLYGRIEGLSCWHFNEEFDLVRDTHFIDTQFPTPDPEAEERLRFEEAMKPAIFMNGVFERDSKGNYIGETINYCWAAWKARAEIAKAK